jgi:hypothetical protein
MHSLKILDERYLRTGCWEEYFDLRKRKEHYITNDNNNDNDNPIESLLKGKGLLPPVGLARLDL